MPVWHSSRSNASVAVFHVHRECVYSIEPTMPPSLYGPPLLGGPGGSDDMMLMMVLCATAAVLQHIRIGSLLELEARETVRVIKSEPFHWERFLDTMTDKECHE